MNAFIQKIKKWVKGREPVDPATFGDPLALKTEWTPAKSGGTNFCTYKLVKAALHRVEFHPTFGAKLFYLIFIIAGAGIVAGFTFSFVSKETFTLNVDSVLPIFIGSVFTIVGGCMLYFGTIPVVFDKHSGYFWKGRKKPENSYNKQGAAYYARLDEIYSIQLISEYCRGNKSSYYSYELNLVLKDGKRVNVIDHGNLKRLREDAGILSGFLQKPVWDAIGIG